MSDHELGSQAFVHADRPSRERFEEPENRFPRETPSPPNKPSGGLWTSTWREDGSCAWLESDAGEWFLDRFEGDPRLFVLEPIEELEVLVIDEVDDLTGALDRFEREPPEEMGRASPEMYALLDFEAMAEEYDAIHLTERGAAVTRYSQPSLYGWDSESTLWLRWAFDSIKEVGSIEGK